MHKTNLDDAAGIRHRSVSLSSAFEFEVGTIWPHFGILIREATQIPGRRPRTPRIWVTSNSPPIALSLYKASRLAANKWGLHPGRINLRPHQKR